MAKLHILNTRQDFESEKMLARFNTYSDYTESLVEGAIIPDGAADVDQVNDATIQGWMKDPEANLSEIVNYMTYMYLSDGSIYQLFTLFRVLPKLNYKIKVFDKKAQAFEDHLIKCDKTLHNIHYKRISRDLISQVCLKGTVVCTWLGNKSTPYLYVFDNPQYVFSPYKRNGEDVAVMDMVWLEEMNEPERLMVFENFKSLKVKSAYAKYERDKQKYQYLELPQDRTCVIKANTLFRNQRVGMPMGLQSLFDINHKKRLRTLEDNIVGKIIKSIAVLTIGDKEHEFNDINPAMRQKIINSVKAAIKNAEGASGVPVSILPNFAGLSFPKIDGLDAFNDSGKFDEVNNAIAMSQGVNATVAGGNGSNYQSSKMSLDILYTRIDAILEEVEPVFQKLFTMVLTKKIAQNYHFEFIKGTPLSKKEEIEVLSKLHAEGTSFKSVVDELYSVTYSELINDSVREIEDMDLRSRIVPPQSTYTLSGSGSSSDTEGAGRPLNENPESDETIKSQESGGNVIQG